MVKYLKRNFVLTSITLQNTKKHLKDNKTVAINPVYDDILYKLRTIFMDEITKDNSVIIEVKKDAIIKLAKFLSAHTRKPCTIGITGETASGKSTITEDIISSINDFARRMNIKDPITRLNTDDYYYDRSEMVKAAGGFDNFVKNYDLDVPEAIELELMKKHITSLVNLKRTYLPKYDMSGTAKRYDNYRLAKPARIIISEGLYTLNEKIADVFDFKIYVDVSFQAQKMRFFQRANARGLGASAETVYKNAKNKAEIYVCPCVKDADIVISGEADRNSYKKFMSEILDLV